MIPSGLCCLLQFNLIPKSYSNWSCYTVIALQIEKLKNCTYRLFSFHDYNMMQLCLEEKHTPGCRTILEV